MTIVIGNTKNSKSIIVNDNSEGLKKYIRIP